MARPSLSLVKKEEKVERVKFHIGVQVSGSVLGAGIVETSFSRSRHQCDLSVTPYGIKCVFQKYKDVVVVPWANVEYFVLKTEDTPDAE